MTLNRVGEHRLLRQRQLGGIIFGGGDAGEATGTGTETVAGGNGGSTAVPSNASSAGPGVLPCPTPKAIKLTIPSIFVGCIVQRCFFLSGAYYHFGAQHHEHYR